MSQSTANDRTKAKTFKIIIDGVYAQDLPLYSNAPEAAIAKHLGGVITKMGKNAKGYQVFAFRNLRETFPLANLYTEWPTITDGYLLIAPLTQPSLLKNKQDKEKYLLQIWIQKDRNSQTATYSPSYDNLAELVAAMNTYVIDNEKDWDSIMHSKLNSVGKDILAGKTEDTPGLITLYKYKISHKKIR